jgi:Mce-associated membrane protein
MPTTPPHPTPSRRRSAGIRRPRVAGRVPGRVGPGDGPAAPHVDARRPGPAGVEDETTVALPTTDPAAALSDDRAATDRAVPGRRRAGRGRSATAAGPPPAAPDRADSGASGGARPSGKRLLRRRPAPAAPRRARRPAPIPVLAGALVLLLGAAVFFGVQNAQIRGTASAQNAALVDVGATAQVSQQVTDALRTIYSFDYTRLDQNEAAARAVITPQFADQFDRLFQQVRQLAPQQQAVVTATVNLSAVKSINGDTATLLVFLDQQATRAQAGSAPQQLAAAGRLTVTAQLVDGTWKIAAVDPR